MEALVFIFALCIPIVLTLIALILRSKYCIKVKKAYNIEYYPPEGLNSLEVAQLYTGLASEKDIISLIIYLANKGYLKIEAIKEEKTFRFVKLKEYEGDNEIERLFFNQLFLSEIVKITTTRQMIKRYKEMRRSNSHVFREGIRVNIANHETLYKSFCSVLIEMKNSLNRKENRNKMFDREARKMGNIVLAFYIITDVLIVLFSVSSFKMFLVAVVFGGTGLFTVFTLIFDKSPISNEEEYNFVMIIGGFFCIPGIAASIPLLINNHMYIIIYIVGIICMCIMTFCYYGIQKKTSKVYMLFNKIKGFATFMETANGTMLQKLLRDDPEYFCNTLPYAYALGLSEKWIEKFYTIEVPAPSWYDCGYKFNVKEFDEFIHSAMSWTLRTMLSNPRYRERGWASINTEITFKKK